MMIEPNQNMLDELDNANERLEIAHRAYLDAEKE